MKCKGYCRIHIDGSFLHTTATSNEITEAIEIPVYAEVLAVGGKSTSHSCISDDMINTGPMLLKQIVMIVHPLLGFI